LIAAGAAALLVTSACHSAEPHVTQRHGGPRFVPSGTLLVDTHGFQQQLLTYRLPTGPQRVLIGFGFFGQARLGAAWGPGGAAYSLEITDSASALNPDTQLYRLTEDTQPDPIGDVLRGGSGLAFATHFAATWTCAEREGAVYVMDVTASHPTWNRFARGCGAGISPDGRTIAYIWNRAVWQGSVSGGPATRVMVPGDVPQLKALGINRFRSSPGIVVGSEGLAVAAGSDTRGAAIVVVRPHRRPRVVPLGATTLRWMAWQPKGRLLAFVDYVNATQSNEIRTFDPATGTLRELAVTSSQGLVWAPDGRSLAIFKGASVVSYVAVDGAQLATGSIPGGPDDWKR
jgi:WD40-like Beta Propeller Repeat